MISLRLTSAAALAASVALAATPWPAHAQEIAADAKVLTGSAAFGDFRSDAPGVQRHITAKELPAPFATSTVRNRVELAPRPQGATLKAPAGFEVKLFAQGLRQPRTMRVAPNGDIFIAESASGQISVMRPAADMTRPEKTEIFASGLSRPYGIAFYPPTGTPEWVYVGNTDKVVRFPYRAGDMKARGAAETVVASLPSGGGHWTRDIAFAKDGSRLYVGVGSGSNVAEGLPRLDAGAFAQWKKEQPLGAIWGAEKDRATVLSFDPRGQDRKIYATGVRNCSGIAVSPKNEVWCATNERDLLGDDLPPDYVTRVQENHFYGWPWYFIGGNEDPRHKGARPDLKDQVTVPDVLLQAHSAALGLTFYEGEQFPATYRGDAFVALHGSWNRRKRTGYKIVRVLMKDGAPTGVYEDFVTGFGIDDARVWGRPVGVTVARDGSLLFSEDGNGTVWRVARTTQASSR